MDCINCRYMPKEDRESDRALGVCNIEFPPFAPDSLKHGRLIRKSGCDFGKAVYDGENIFISCVRADKLVKGCIVRMRSDSGVPGYGNPQCISGVFEQLGTISLYGHNQHYKDYGVLEVIEYPLIESNQAGIS